MSEDIKSVIFYGTVISINYDTETNYENYEKRNIAFVDGKPIVYMTPHVDVTSTNITNIWLKDDDGHEFHFTFYKKIPIRETHRIKILAVQGNEYEYYYMLTNITTGESYKFLDESEIAEYMQKYTDIPNLLTNYKIYLMFTIFSPILFPIAIQFPAPAKEIFAVGAFGIFLYLFIMTIKSKQKANESKQLLLMSVKKTIEQAIGFFDSVK